MSERVFYVVIAYRWGWLNNTWYMVHIGCERDRAIAVACYEALNRAGKYGIAVYGICGDPLEWKLIHYVSSLYGEGRPYRNWRLEWIDHVGARVCDAYEEGVELPAWLVKEIEEYMKIARGTCDDGFGCAD